MVLNVLKIFACEGFGEAYVKHTKVSTVKNPARNCYKVSRVLILKFGCQTRGVRLTFTEGRLPLPLQGSNAILGLYKYT